MGKVKVMKHCSIVWVFLNICHFLSPTKAEFNNANCWKGETDFSLVDQFNKHIKVLKSGLEFLTLRLEILEMNNDKQGPYFTKFDRRLQAIEENLEKLGLSEPRPHEPAMGNGEELVKPCKINQQQPVSAMKVVGTTSPSDYLQIFKNSTLLQKINSKQRRESVEIQGDLMAHFNGQETLKICVKKADSDFEPVCSDMRYPTNCADSHRIDCSNNKCRIQNRLYGSESFLVACNDTSEAGGWTVIQRRINGSVDFHRDWPDYKRGFGDLDGDFWLGLDKLHALTTMLAPVELLIELQDFDNVRKYARYDAFGIGDEASKYTLTTLGTYSGTAGDSLSYNKGRTFATKDQDNGNRCALNEHGAWWYDNCSYSNLNGQYLETPKTDKLNGIYWHGFRGHYYSMQFVQMMIRPKYI